MDSSLLNMVSSLRASHDEMVEQLHQWCEINTGTENLAGLTLLHKELYSAFQDIADEIKSCALPSQDIITLTGETTKQSFGNALLIRKRPDLPRRVLLSGHMDTVYSANHPFQKLSMKSPECLNGPGVSDMKGGLVVMLKALRAFESTPFKETLGWDVLINPDEEVGSPASSFLLETLATKAQAALVYEPAMTSEGMFAKNRKGSGKFTLIATGKAAHAGRDFSEGRNAICYLAEAIGLIHALNGKREGVTINIGQVAGGEALNTVPAKAVLKLDIRINLEEDAHWVHQELLTIAKSLARKDYGLTLNGYFGRPVKQVNKATEHLFARIKHIGKTLGLTLDWKDSGGCSDGNNLAQYGLPVIDTLGVRGGAIHSSDEFILLDSLVERASLSALLLVDLAQGGLLEINQ